MVDLDDFGRESDAAARLCQRVSRSRLAGVLVDDLDRRSGAVLDDAQAAARLRAAVDNSDGDLVVVGRTEIARSLGPEAVAPRLRLFESVGADAGFAAGVPGLARTSDALSSWQGELPLLAVVEDPADPSLASLGVRLAMSTPTALLAAAATLDRVYHRARAGSAGVAPAAFTWPQLDALLAEG